MNPRFAVLLGALVLVAAWCVPVSASDKIVWYDDSPTEIRSDRLFDAGDYLDAESASREVLARYPDSVTALFYHVKALNALGRYDESLTECRKAVALEPQNGAAYEWLGRTLVLAHQYDEGIETLTKSLQFGPTNPTTLIWISGAISLRSTAGEPEVGDVFNFITTTDDTKTRAQNAAIIADFFRQTGHGDLAIQWWRKSYALGNIDAARYLEWAYNGLTPGFPYDPGESSYWQRRGPNDPYAWFPRLAQADQIVAFAHGWGIVLIYLAAALILPWLSIGIIAILPARGLINEPSIPWTERARRAWPFMVFLAFGVLVMPVLDWGNAFTTPASVLPMPKWLFLLIVALTGYWSVNSVAVYWARLYRTDAGTTWENIKDTAVVLFLRGTAIILFIVAGVSLPSEFNWRAALTLLATVLAYFYIQFGGWIRIASLVRVIVPAGSDLVHDAAELARARNLPAPTVWLLRWRKANAFALPFSNAILVTENLRALLSREEIRSILAHELAHLCEDRVTRASRILTPLLLLPIFTMGLWGSYFWVALGGSYLFFILGTIFLRKRARRMEERADTFGKEAESETGDYPLALAKLYEANLIPAVMAGKRKVHPHLYDRLLAAGLTPDYPRPKPPGRWGAYAGFLAITIHGACLWALWLCLF